jgi:hypothetical protein
MVFGRKLQPKEKIRGKDLIFESRSGKLIGTVRNSALYWIGDPAENELPTYIITRPNKNDMLMVEYTKKVPGSVLGEDERLEKGDLIVRKSDNRVVGDVDSWTGMIVKDASDNGEYYFTRKTDNDRMFEEYTQGG